MIKVNREVVGPAVVTVLWLQPDRSLTRCGMWALGLTLVGLVMFAALLGAIRGNVFAPAFALVESLGVAVALVVAWRGGERSERIRLGADILEVEARPGHHRARFQSGWVRVRLSEDAGRQRLMLASHGRKLEIGAFLADAEREALRDKLTMALAALRAPDKRTNREA